MEKFSKGTVFIVCPEQTDFNSLLELNSFFIEQHSPYILCYFEGKQISVGPSVLPGLTPFLSCYLEHRRSGLEQTIDNHFSWQPLGELTAAWPLPEGSRWDISAFWASVLQPGIWLIKAEYEEPYPDPKICDAEWFSATLTLEIQ